MYKKAAQLQIRFDTEKGRVSVEDLFHMSLPVLNNVAKDLRKKTKESEEEDFLGESSKASEEDKLKFDIVVDVINTLKKARQDAQDAQARKARRQEILAELEVRQKDGLKNRSEEDLQKELAELG
jgi:hypothetical protein